MSIRKTNSAISFIVTPILFISVFTFHEESQLTSDCFNNAGKKKLGTEKTEVRDYFEDLSNVRIYRIFDVEV